MEMRSLTRILVHSRPTTSLTPRSSQLEFMRHYASSSPLYNPSNSNFSPKSRSSTSTPKSSTNNTAAGIDQILNELNLNTRSQSQPQSAATSDTSSSSTPSSTFTSDQLRGPNTQGSFGDALSLSRAVGLSAETDNWRQPIRKVDLKLGPTLGRQVHVEPERGMDLAAALRSLQVACSVNRVRQQSNQQKFHIRRGQMKKNLRMERWRKLFKFSFTHTVNKIQRMRNQGW